jgi:hypothetical protein
VQERFEDIKEVTRSRTSKKTDTIMAKAKLTKDRQYHAKGKLTKDGQYHGQRETDKRTNCDI